MMKNATLPRTVEFKTFPFELKSVDEDQGIVSGYLSTFGNVDEQNDRVVKGAFKKTIQEAKARKDNGRRFLYPMLWMHDPEQPIGGVTDAIEDEHGLLITAQLDISTNVQGIPHNPKATMVFSGFKSGYIDEMSMGYNAIQKEYQNGVRNLKECRLIESSAVTMLFAANPEALVPSAGVKNILGDNEDMDIKDIDIANMEIKGVCGNTSGPIGPRDEAWDGAKAKGQIFAAAQKDDGTISASIAKKYFMYVDGDGSKKGDYSYPFWYVGDSPHICVGAVKAIANAIQGARGADAPSGLKSKVETLYSRINNKYPDETPLTPPWKSDDKGSNRAMEKKDFNSLYQDAQAQDAYEDWCDLINALTGAMTQAFTIGDTPIDDMKDALEQFSTATLDWAAKAQEVGLTDYLSDQQGCSSSPYIPYSMRMGYASRNEKPDIKTGARFSEDTKAALDQHVKSLNDVSSQMKNMSDDLAAHAGSLEQKANDLTQLYQSEGQGSAFAEDNSDDGKSRVSRQDRKKSVESEERRGPSSTPTREKQPEKSTDFTVDDLAALLV
jgi:hypothetical protein